MEYKYRILQIKELEHQLEFDEQTNRTGMWVSFELTSSTRQIQIFPTMLRNFVIIKFIPNVCTQKETEWEKSEMIFVNWDKRKR